MTMCQINPIHTRIALAAFRSLGSQFAYCSGAITSGEIAYEIFEREGVAGREELESKLGRHAFEELVIAPNIAALTKFTDDVKERTRLPVINPAKFKLDDWYGVEEQYMDLWERFVHELVNELHMSDGWQYSTGGIMELRRGLEVQTARELQIYDHNGSPLTGRIALANVESAVEEIRDREFQLDRLETAYEKLHKTVRREAA